MYCTTFHFQTLPKVRSQVQCFGEADTSIKSLWKLIVFSMFFFQGESVPETVYMSLETKALAR